jgi:BirA family biotin operon repressor/biotin-[acetyl-CoA-carboxylase] ligase
VTDAVERIVARLAAGGGHDGWVSGEALAAELGVTRAAVGKQVRGLRERGFAIDAQPRRGYRLVRMPDTLEPAIVRPRLATRWLARQLDWLAECDSTNDEAAARARAGAVAGTTVLSEAQRRGRGRIGRVWFSPPGRNVYASVVVRPALAPASVPPLALAVGVAAWEALRALGVPVDLKWPNDLLVGRRKLGGVLIEMASELTRVSFVVIGLGINVNLTEDELPEELRPIATSVRIATGSAPARAELFARVAERLEGWYERFLGEGAGAAVAAFRVAAAPTLGRRVQVAGEGPSPILGIAEDVSDDGRLLVRDDAGRRHAITAGEVAL